MRSHISTPKESNPCARRQKGGGRQPTAVVRGRARPCCLRYWLLDWPSKGRKFPELRAPVVNWHQELVGLLKFSGEQTVKRVVETDLTSTMASMSGHVLADRCSVGLADRSDIVDLSLGHHRHTVGEFEYLV